MSATADAAGQDFLTLADHGRNGAWRYVIGWATVLILWIGFGTAIAVATSYIVPISTYVLINLTFLPLLLALYVAIRVVHRRPFRTLVTGAPKIRRGLILRSALTYFALMLALTAFQALLMPEAFALQFDPAALAVFLPVALVLTSIQSASEELAIRGYLMQGLRRLTARRWLIVAATSAVFVVLHYGNPDVMAAPLSGFASLAAFGVVAALAAIKANGLEPALGLHAANNLFIFMIVNPVAGGIPTPAILTYTAPPGLIDLALFLTAGALFYLATPRAGPGADDPVTAPGSS